MDVPYKLHKGDCLEYMRSMKTGSVDCIVTSPPFNLMSQYSNKSQMKQSIPEKRLSAWYFDNMPEKEYQLWQIEILKEMTRVCNGVVFYNHQVRYAWGRKGEWYHPVHWLNGFTVWCEIIWNRGKGISGAKRPVLAEQRIYMIGKPKTYHNIGLTNVWNIPEDRSTDHVCPLPIEIYKNCISMVTNEGDVVFDPFMGTGNGAIASLELGRKFVGCEIDDEYFHATQHRLHLTAFGAGGLAVNPLQSNLFAEVSPATSGGK